MTKISYAGYRFPPVIIQQAIWLYVRFTLSFRDVEDLLVERGIMVSFETVRRWVNHFGPKIAADLRKRRPKPYTIWHLDEVYLKIDGRVVNLWRAVDAEGEVLDVLVQTRRNKRAALKLMRMRLKKYGVVPEKLVTDDLRSYAAEASDLEIARRHERGRWRNNRAENSHQPTRRRERKMQGFKGSYAAWVIRCDCGNISWPRHSFARTSIVAKRKSLDLGQPRNVKDRGAFMAQGGEDLPCDKTAKSTRSARSILDNLGQGR